MSLFAQHEALLRQAIEALQNRTFWSAYPEHPSPKVYGETADADGKASFEAHLGQSFAELKQGEPSSWVGGEESPYTQDKLGIRYPAYPVETLIAQAEAARKTWSAVPFQERAGILAESLEGMKRRFFEIAYATMHTTGQGYMMAFQASGPHAADRALEAIASGLAEMERVTPSAHWDKPMGKFNIVLEKTWKAQPKGLGLVIGCSTFPTWNSVPGLYASLVTGNPVIVKAHPKAILPIAIVVAEIQKVLEAQGLPATIVQLAADTLEAPLTKELAQHPAVKLIDYTGGPSFGAWLDTLASQKHLFTEKAGVNSIILDSVDDVEAVAANLAFSLCLYTGQMCTAPQNFFLPASGIKTPQGVVSVEEFGQKLADAIKALVDNPKAGPFVLGAIQNPATAERVGASASLGKVILAAYPVENPQFPKARTSSPLLMQIEAEKFEVYSRELFGPIAFLIPTQSTAHSIELAAKLAATQGAISCGAYTTDPDVMTQIAEGMAESFTSVSFNLTGGIYVNQNAAFSDFHVTGGNPAGNASFTNPEFVLRRFTVIGTRVPAPVAAA